jgi:dGTPase
LLLRNQQKLADRLGGLDPDVAEASALAHDLGHPPFGHIAEDELDRLLVRDGVKDGFNGNAQSFRIVTRLALHRANHPGLNLTRATLNGILKYPWLRGSGGEADRKWGAYESDREIFEWARRGHRGSTARSIEAELMDGADDVTYAVHDVEDFYRAGRIPLDRLRNDSGERSRFLDFARAKYDGKELSWDEVKKGFTEIIEFISVREPYSSTWRLRTALRTLTAALIGRYIGAIALRSPTKGDKCPLDFEPVLKWEIWLWKQLPWYYVIKKPGLATQQHGLRRIVECLYAIFCKAALAKEYSIFPAGFREALEQNDEDHENRSRRIVVDLIAGMAEREAVMMYNRLTGTAPGSALDYLGY